MVRKKILIISSSPRKHGNSDLLCDEFLHGARDAGHEVEKVNLIDKDIHACIGCSVCRNNGGACVQKDDMADLLEKLIEADAFVLASPVYFYTFTAQLKTFIDRTYAKISAIHDKDAYLITTGAAPTEDYMDTMIRCYQGFIGCFNNIRNAGTICGCGAIEKGDVLKMDLLKQAYGMGNSIIS